MIESGRVPNPPKPEAAQPSHHQRLATLATGSVDQADRHPRQADLGHPVGDPLGAFVEPQGDA